MPAPTKRLYSAKETYHLKEITNRSYPILFASVIIPWSIHNKGPRLRVLRTLCLYGHKNILTFYGHKNIYSHSPGAITRTHTHTQTHTLSLSLSIIPFSPSPPPLSLWLSHTHSLSCSFSRAKQDGAHNLFHSLFFYLTRPLSFMLALLPSHKHGP